MKKFKILPALIGTAILFASCTSSSIDGDAQEERRDSVSYFNTSSPATEGPRAVQNQTAEDSSAQLHDQSDSSRGGTGDSAGPGTMR